MLLVRYVALAALVLWLGGLVTLNVLTGPSRDVLRQFDLVGYSCGALIIICLVVMKLVGPPPAAFIPRLALAVLMLAIALYEGLVKASAPLTFADEALGVLLLYWYARE